ncbi:transposase [Colwellia sp. MSW7]|uniref:Transposase n=1 Tax=Colwellia maritima TaxID=2912588 RepID=A0ABS9X4V7_9GAMM|nr:transposase [Colwellia maritima]MCI2285259.1 transposase [Colwellia maritima]
MHRGNNRQDIFRCEEDMLRIKEDIFYALEKSGCQLHAYVIMTNHLHLLITPENKDQLAIFMQMMANKYVRYFNSKYERTGTIWEGRYKSCLVDSEQYLFALHKYIEMNPIKAKMVKSLDDYKWSSYAYNALGQKDKLIREHRLYQKLGKTVKVRCKEYQSLFTELDLSKQNDTITQATLRGEVYGSANFHQHIEKYLTRPTKLSAHGGDRKSKTYKNQVS